MESTPSNTDAIVRGVAPGVNAEVTLGVSPNEWLDAWMVGWNGWMGFVVGTRCQNKNGTWENKTTEKEEA